jgi:hypothetical protein
MPEFLKVKIEIQKSDGTWLDVSNGTTYRVNSSTFENSAVQFRRDEVSNSFVEGKFLVNALRDNVIENLVIYAYGDSVAALKTNIDAVTNAVSQINFNTRVTLENSQRFWQCWASDYTVNITNAMYHNRQAMITVQLHRLPTETVTTV